MRVGPVQQLLTAGLAAALHDGHAEHLHLLLGMMDLQYLLSKLSQREHLANLDRELLQDILRYLHRIGLLVWYEEIKHLESTVFLQPTFLITTFKVSVGNRTLQGPSFAMLLSSRLSFLSLPAQLLVRDRLVQQLESISVEALIAEHATIRDRSNWVWAFKSKAMLCHQAVRALVKYQLFSEGMQDIFEEIMGDRTRRGKGKLFSLLEHFELCLEVRQAKALNPQASEFVPGKTWETTRDQSESWYLFPTYLNQTEEVAEVWGGDHHEDLHIRTYFSPEIPEGFFHRCAVLSSPLMKPLAGHLLGLVGCRAGMIISKPSAVENVTATM